LEKFGEESVNSSKLTFKEFYELFKDPMELEICCGHEILDKRIKNLEVQRPGVSLAGWVEDFPTNRFLIFGQLELGYLNSLDRETILKRVDIVITKKTPAILISKNYNIPDYLIDVCIRKNVVLFRSKMRTMELFSKLFFSLKDLSKPVTTVHGTLMDVYGLGVLIQGDSSVGKSEAALGLLERKHRLISDDVVKIEKKGDTSLIGTGPDLTRHFMEIRGIGLIDVAALFGAVCIRHDISIDLVVQLELWDEDKFYDRIGFDRHFKKYLGIDVPYYLLPVKSGRDVTLLIETISLNHRLKVMGYDSAKEFSEKLLDAMNNKSVKNNENNKKIKSKK